MKAGTVFCGQSVAAQRRLGRDQISPSEILHEMPFSVGWSARLCVVMFEIFGSAQKPESAVL